MFGTFPEIRLLNSDESKKNAFLLTRITYTLQYRNLFDICFISATFVIQGMLCFLIKVVDIEREHNFQLNIGSKISE